MSEDPRKRSRFDKPSRFDQAQDPRKAPSDRRSRSPSDRASGGIRDRSPVSKTIEASDDTTKDGPGSATAAAAAAAAAARIMEQVKARKASQPVDVPPIQAVSGVIQKQLQ